MKRSIILIVLSLLLFFVFALPALAQDGGLTVPDTAVEGLALLAALFGSWVSGGYIGSYVTDLVKKLSGLTGDVMTGEQQTRLSGAGAEFVAVALSIGAALGVNYATPVAEFLDTSGVWELITLSTPAVLFAYKRFYDRKKANA